ncbi:dipeptide/oligopeptide/nickel ABC transporter ATP-binding protein [Desulfuromonas versatilis]|uniref:Dipeptide/oligopeptide/nickel ABC transporter ATP-binding protein n=1 Tax=Desulfuromonas versatilis TaxID=2802975 RepID=A0ABM8HR74_9BACT|nr:ABC transporter ATP-binding protein [Desulfuromonas versatilis]BCR04407.1 dipeptide/oligopeptide/nickel ABC transporter ATP-binding protein [Desulfuromonas versatilis]
MQPLLDVRDLKTYFFTSSGLVKAIGGIDFSIGEGETLALVGESGCGKSMTALSLLRLVPPPGKIVEGEIFFRGEDLLHIPEAEMRRIRGNQIAMIFQEPMTSLNPVFRIERQIGEVLRLHKGLDAAAARDAAIDLLHQVGIPSPEQRVREYPHQLSGGMRQRVMIAMALACDPRLLIADEPTTALDVTIQAQIMELLLHLKQERNMATLLITHDLGVVAESADRVAIMYGGLMMEYAPVEAIFASPRHPYTQGLLACIPRLGEKRRRLQPISGQVPSPENLPPGCSFLERCPEAFAPCRQKLPPLREVAPGHLVRCWKD